MNVGQLITFYKRIYLIPTSFSRKIFYPPPSSLVNEDVEDSFCPVLKIYRTS